MMMAVLLCFGIVPSNAFAAEYEYDGYISMIDYNGRGYSLSSSLPAPFGGYSTDKFTELRINDLTAFRTAYCSSDDNMVDGVPDMDFYKMYKADDMRKKIYFTEQGDGRVVCDKYNLLTQSWKDGGALMPFRLAEMFLI